MLAFITASSLVKAVPIHSRVDSIGRLNIQVIRPRAKKFLERRTPRPPTPESFTASRVISSMGTSMTVYPRSEPSRSGLVAYAARARLRSSKASRFTTMVPAGARSARLALRAAGFIATRTSGLSPGVRMSLSAMCTWKEETPAMDPAGARISAG